MTTIFAVCTWQQVALLPLVTQHWSKLNWDVNWKFFIVSPSLFSIACLGPLISSKHDLYDHACDCVLIWWMENSTLWVFFVFEKISRSFPVFNNDLNLTGQCNFLPGCVIGCCVVKGCHTGIIAYNVMGSTELPEEFILYLSDAIKLSFTSHHSCVYVCVCLIRHFHRGIRCLIAVRVDLHRLPAVEAWGEQSLTQQTHSHIFTNTHTKIVQLKVDCEDRAVCTDREVLSVSVLLG